MVVCFLVLCIVALLLSRIFFSVCLFFVSFAGIDLRVVTGWTVMKNATKTHHLSGLIGSCHAANSAILMSLLIRPSSLFEWFCTMRLFIKRFSHVRFIGPFVAFFIETLFGSEK
ncbi:hypothetical protein PAHAL_2G051900 [Panicum hallii]|jgi:hypothetical protein|uniref:Uncharacterized protein n=1 Tax=Panicum hallii TaxID=206008 RepID=A0A2S3GW34_9POAL|nr:hypothetical protein PAHAL_2G051900 [Panicum hallii]